MTTKSARRAAEMAVIDAAIADHKYGDYIEPPPYAEKDEYADRLYAACRAYLELEFEKTGEAQIPNDGPDTSIQAGQSLKNLGKLAQQVYDEIAVASPSRYPADRGGLTVDQTEQILNRSHQSVSARVNELRNKGWIVDSGRKRLTRSRRSAIIWVPSAAGRSQRHV